ncbi:MAG: alpha/beta fold hydrolase [Bacteroidia bacterium]|nr:alpha/beta fold hydrolase [Bacteroidia bacterium]NNL79179.1 alpha/beta fold hydrolase [Flavobacteriaceae bacterium]
MLKKILKIISLLLGISLMVLLGLYLIPPSQEKIAYNYSDLEHDTSIDSKVGWYLANNGKEYQITWGAKKGLQLNYFDSLRSNLKNIRLTKISANEFDTNGDLQNAEVNFDLADSTLTIEVSTSKTNFTAIKKDSLHYKQEEIAYSNKDIKLAGLLMTPFGNITSTAIILIHGSGVSDRDNFWYMYQADYLARNGYMVLLPDKRGCGKSRGEWHTASFDDFANDIKSAQEYLVQNKANEFEKLGVLGLSQGGWISHVVNQDPENLDFIVDVVSSASTPNEQVKYEIRNDIKNSGVPEFLAKPLSVIFAKRAMGKRKIWWEKNGSFDPVLSMRETKTPILKIFAAEDENVPVENSIALINEMLSTHSNLPLTINTFKDSGHALISPESGWIRNDYLDYVIDWISKQ